MECSVFALLSSSCASDRFYHSPVFTASSPSAMPSKSTEALFLFPRHLLALLARLGECDGDRLLAAFHLAAFSTLAALRFSPLVAVHLALHFGAGAARIFPFPFLGHTRLLDKR